MNTVDAPDVLGFKFDDVRTRGKDRWRLVACVFFSALFHAIVLLILMNLPWSEPDEVVPIPAIPVEVVAEKTGQSGAAGDGPGNSLAAAAARAGSSDANPAEEPPAPETPAESQAETPPDPTPPVLTPPLRETITTDAPLARVAELPPIPPHKPTAPHPTTPQPPAPSTPTQSAAVPSASPTNAAAATAATNSSTTTGSATQGLGGQGRGEVGAGRAEIGNGSRDGTADDYLEKLRARIARFLKTPDDKCSQGKVISLSVDLVFQRDGTILDAKIAQGTGCPDSDTQILRMIRAASPLPPIPPQLPGDPAKVQLPLVLRPGLFDRLFH